MNLRFDSVGGASGDMILGALSDLGADLGAIATQVHAILPDPFHLHIAQETIGGIAGTRVSVELQKHHHHHDESVIGNQCSVISNTDNRLPITDHRQPITDHHHHHGRNLPEIIAMLSSAPQHDAAQLAIKVFCRLAEAEAAVHGTTADKVHFHEVGAVDALVDIYGSCLALIQLGVTSVSVGPLPEGHGTVTCAHGVMPNPAPATARLTTGHPCERIDEPFELVTPTGAALLMTWKEEFPETRTPVASVKSGYGFGQRTLTSRPNLLRATLGTVISNQYSVISNVDTRQPTASSQAPITDYRLPITDHTGSVLCLQTNLDDVSPEVLGYTLEKLLEAGALDAWFTPIQMKKNRPGVMLSALCDASQADALRHIIFRETGTLGIRQTTLERTVLERRTETAQTPYGPVRMKVTEFGAKPEYEDCKRLAEQHGVPLRNVLGEGR